MLQPYEKKIFFFRKCHLTCSSTNDKCAVSSPPQNFPDGSRLYPLGQRHLKLPGMFMHVPVGLHKLGWSVHSFTSRKSRSITRCVHWLLEIVCGKFLYLVYLQLHFSNSAFYHLCLRSNAISQFIKSIYRTRKLRKRI